MTPPDDVVIAGAGPAGALAACPARAARRARHDLRSRRVSARQAVRRHAESRRAGGAGPALRSSRRSSARLRRSTACCSAGLAASACAASTARACRGSASRAIGWTLAGGRRRWRPAHGSWTTTTVAGARTRTGRRVARGARAPPALGNRRPLRARASRWAPTAAVRGSATDVRPVADAAASAPLGDRRLLRGG